MRECLNKNGGLNGDKYPCDNLIYDDELYCSKCGEFIGKKELKCEYCGQEIVDIKAKKCSRCGAEIELDLYRQNRNRCEHCFKQIPRDIMFCPYCGKATEIRMEEVRKVSIKVIFIFLATFALISTITLVLINLLF